MGLNGQFNARIQRLEKIVKDMPSGREVPQPSVADYGKVIGVDENGEYSLENVPQEVPTPTEIDAGKVVKVNASGTGYELGEGGGSDLPPYTSDDNGKVLTLGEVEGSVTTTIVPEQSVTVADGEPAPLSDANEDYFTNDYVNKTATLTVNGNKEIARLQYIDGVYAWVSDSYVIMLLTDSPDGRVFLTGLFDLLSNGTYTVALYIPSVEPKWKTLEKRSVFDYDYQILIDYINGEYTTSASFYDALKAYLKGRNVYFTLDTSNSVNSLAYYDHGSLIANVLEFNGSSNLQVTVHRINFSSEGLVVVDETYPN